VSAGGETSVIFGAVLGSDGLKEGLRAAPHCGRGAGDGRIMLSASCAE